MLHTIQTGDVCVCLRIVRSSPILRLRTGGVIAICLGPAVFALELTKEDELFTWCLLPSNELMAMNRMRFGQLLVSASNSQNG